MKLSAPFSAIVILSLAGCGSVQSAGDEATISQEDAAQLARRMDGRIIGEPRKCVSTSQLGQPVAYGSKTIVYSGRGRTEYRNDLPYNCPGLDDDDIILTRIYGSQLCSGDTIEPVDRLSGFSGPMCRLGEFIPYTKPEKQS